MFYLIGLGLGESEGHYGERAGNREKVLSCVFGEAYTSILVHGPVKEPLVSQFCCFAFELKTQFVLKMSFL